MARLSINFHQTFIPERRYITAMLKYAAGDNQGTDQEISSATGIPVGQSSGKVPAILNYSAGMGLICVEKGENTGQKHPILTDFGRIVLLEDVSLSEPFTQWLSHLHLCRIVGGAEVWYQVFGPGRDVLGMEFLESEIDDYLNNILGKKSKSHVGPLVRTYEEQAAFKDSEILRRVDLNISRSHAPVLDGFVPGYSAFLLSLWETHFSEERQVTLSDFENEIFFQRICGWTEHQFETVIEMMQIAGVIDVDRQMRPWVITRKSDASAHWRGLYDKLA